MSVKSKSAFRTIAEVAEEIGVAPHVLRFWETKFKELSPMKASGGRRYYRPDDVALIKLIRNFLYEKRYTIEGVQKLFKQQGIKTFLNTEIQKDFFEDQTKTSEVKEQELSPQTTHFDSSQLQLLQNIQQDLIALKTELQSALS